MEWRRLPKRLLVLSCLAAALLATARAEVRHFHATDGNYRVTITFGDAQASTDTTVKAELGRLMLESVRTNAGQTVSRTFLVNVRGPQIAGGGEVRLKEREKSSTAEPNSASLYFNQNGYTADGKRLVYTAAEGIFVLDLQTQQARQVVSRPVRLIEAGRKHQRVYYVRDRGAWWTDIDSGQSHRIAALPPRASVSSVNADETLLAGTYAEAPQGQDSDSDAIAQGAGRVQPLDQPRNKGQMMEERLAANLPMALFTLNVETGALQIIHRSNDWLNHLLFSPSDPGLLMFCHEGPWHKVDRIWTIRTDGSKLTKIHNRTMAMEIFGHEFWSADGKTIWYDLQTPRGEDFWVAGYNVETGARTRYHLQRNEWSIHFNISHDGRLFCGDGGDPGQVAHAPDGQWIYLFRPQLVENRGIAAPDFIQPGVFHAEKLVNMARHQYRLEPNVSFTPDNKWVVFRSNMFGASYVFAVAVEKER